MLSCKRNIPANPLVLVDRAVFAPSAEIANKVGEMRLAAKKLLGHLVHAYELPVPRRQLQIAVEHQDAARHVVEDGAEHGFAVGDARNEELRGLRHLGDFVLARGRDRGRPPLDLRPHVLLKTLQPGDHGMSHVQ